MNNLFLIVTYGWLKTERFIYKNGLSLPIGGLIMSEKTLWQRITALVRQPATPSLDDNLELVNGPKFSQNVSKRIYEIAYNGSALEAYTSSDVKGKRLTERGRDIVDFLSRYDGELAASEGRFTGQGFDYEICGFMGHGRRIWHGAIYPA